MLHCFGHIDNIEGVFVSPERKKNYRVKACELFLELPPAAAKASDTKISTKNTHTTQRKNGSNVQKRRDFL
jgi:hypothetical protein